MFQIRRHRRKAHARIRHSPYSVKSPFQRTLVEITQLMKATHHHTNRRNLSLGEFLSIIDSCARDKNERLATIQDLFASGRVRVMSRGGFRKVRLSLH